MRANINFTNKQLEPKLGCGKKTSKTPLILEARHSVELVRLDLTKLQRDRASVERPVASWLHPPGLRV